MYCPPSEMCYLVTLEITKCVAFSTSLHPCVSYLVLFVLQVGLGSSGLYG